MTDAPAVIINLPGHPFSNLPSVATVAALRARDSSDNANGDNIAVDGGTEIGDGAGGLYTWAAASMAADDGISVVRPTDRTVGQAGRYILTGAGGVDAVVADLATEVAARIAADSAIEAEVDALQGTFTSGRREYATYASAVSDAATPVFYAAVTLGQVAEVPTSDTGTHTDPVVGDAVCTGTISGTVFTAGAPSAGAYKVGYVLSGTNVTAGTTILSLGTGTGGAGTYNLSVSSTAGSTTITGKAPNSGIFRWTVSPAGWLFMEPVAAVSAAPYATAAAASATAAAASAASLAGIVPQLSEDTLVGARESAVMPAAEAATVSGTHFTITTGGANVPVNLTGDQIGDTTTTVNAILQIVTGSAGTAFVTAIGRWTNNVGAQIGADVALTKTATQISLTGTQPVGARKLTFYLTPAATTTCRFLTYQFGTPARPTTDAWYLALLGAGIADNDPEPIDYVATDANWNPITGRVTVPATAGGAFQVSVPSGVADGDVLWVLFDSPLEPTAWLQLMSANFGASGGGSGVQYLPQILHLGGNRFAAALYVQSAADGDFYGPGWTWNNTGAATYFENIKLYLGVKPPFVEQLSAIQLKGVRDEIEAERIMPLISLADDSCAISANQFQPSPGLDLVKFFGTGTKFQNFATPGNTLTQSASTAGLLPIHVSVTSNVIPASTSPVAITAWDYDPITSGSTGNPAYDPYAYLCGVFGRLSADAWTSNSPSAGHLFFTPVVAPAWPIDVPAGSKLILRASRKRRGGLTLFPISSVNGTGGGFANDIALVDAVFAANDPATIAGFVGLTPNPYASGASILATFAAKSYFSRLYNPNIMSAATVAEAMSLFGWTWTGTENADWLAGNIGIPGSMRWSGDTFHPFTDVAAYVVAKNHFISTQVTSYLEAWA